MRKDLGDLSKLKEAITNRTLVHPPVVDLNYNLIAGGRRYAAHVELKVEELFVNVREDPTSATELRMMELAENEDRKEMTWQERVASVAEVHRMSQKEANMAAKQWSRERTGALLGVHRAKVDYCVFLDGIISNPKHALHEQVSKAESMSEALRIVAQDKIDAAQRMVVAGSLTTAVANDSLAKSTLDDFINSSIARDNITEVPKGTSPLLKVDGVTPAVVGETAPQPTAAQVVAAPTVVIPLTNMLKCGDSTTLLYSFGEESFQHIQADPPYAIDVEMMKQDSPTGGLRNIERTEDEHQVEDNFKLLSDIIPAMFRVLKPGGFCVLWTDEETRPFIIDQAVKIGFKYQRWSLVWVKTDVCKNEAAQTNFTKATEIAVVLRKGTATLSMPQGVNYKLCGHADRQKWKHPFAKPPELLEWVWRAIALPGQPVLDPFMGCGTGVYAAAKIGLAPTGIDIVQHHYDEAMLNMMGAYNQWLAPRKVEFK